MKEMSEKILFNLMEKNEKLEYEVERLQGIIDKAINYLETNNFYIGAFNSYNQPLLDILQDKKKNTKTK
jgi:hypothetical protein